MLGCRIPTRSHNGTALNRSPDNEVYNNLLPWYGYDLNRRPEWLPGRFQLASELAGTVSKTRGITSLASLVGVTLHALGIHSFAMQCDAGTEKRQLVFQTRILFLHKKPRCAFYCRGFYSSCEYLHNQSDSYAGANTLVPQPPT